MVRFVTLVQPVILASTAYFILRRSGAVGYGEYVVSGSGLMTLWATTLWSSATDIDRERWMGTLELLLVAPVPFPLVVLGKILGNLALGCVSFVLAYLTSTVLLRVPIPVAHPGRLALALVVLVLAFVGFSLFLALLFALSRRANPIANGLSYPIYLVSGVFFPLTLLPGWAQALGLGMPLAWAKEALRWAMVGAEAAAQLRTGSYWHALVGLLVVGLAYFGGAILLYRYVIHRKMRQSGQLGVA